MAYLDGEANAQVTQHIDLCPECSATAGEYARLQNQLRVRLDRFDCPAPQELGDYELGLLGALERTQVAVHILECPQCAAELRTLRDFLSEDRAPPNLGVVERVRRVVATLLAPTPNTALAGLRGTADAATQTYRAGDLTISLTTGPGTDRRRRTASLAGLIWSEDPAAGDQLAGTAALIAADGDRQTTETDDLGNFAFDDLTPGTYGLEVAIGDQVVAIEDLRIDR